MPVDTRASNATKRPGLIQKSGTTTRRSSEDVAKEKQDKARAKEEKKQAKVNLELAKARRLEEVTLNATLEDAAYSTPVPQRVATERKSSRNVLKRTESTMSIFEDAHDVMDDMMSMPPPSSLPNLKRKSVVVSSAAGSMLTTARATTNEATVSFMVTP